MDIVQLLKPALEILDSRARDAFRSGQQILARVVGIENDGRIRLQLPSGQTVSASTEARVNIGDTVRVVVEPSPEKQAPSAPNQPPARPEPAGTAGPGKPAPAAPAPERQAAALPPAGTPPRPQPASAESVRAEAPPPGPGTQPKAPAPARSNVPPQPTAGSRPNVPAQGQTPSPPAGAANELMETLKGLLVAARRTASREFATLASDLSRLVSQAEFGAARLPEPAREQLILIARTLQAYEQLGKGDTISDEAVRRLVEDSGLFLESRLAGGRDVSHDIKAALLKLRAHLESLQPPAKGGEEAGARPHDVSTLAAKASAQAGDELSDIEARQAANLISRNDAPAFHATIPLTGDFRRSELTVMKDGGGRENTSAGGAPHYRVVLQLEMTRLGSIRVDAIQAGTDINLGFIVKDRKTLAALEEGFPYLRERFAEQEVPVRDIFARAGSEPAPAAAEPHKESRLFSRKA